MSLKRNRSSNWDEEEKLRLRGILKDYTHIIENKSLKTNTNRAKLQAWEEVQKKFNELNCSPRTLNQLQVQWKGMKLMARKQISNFRKDTLKTGGGAKPPSPSSEAVQVVDLLNPGELLIDYNIYDSDGPLVSNNEDANTEKNEEKVDLTLASTSLDTGMDKNINNSTEATKVLNSPLNEVHQKVNPRKIVMSQRRSAQKERVSKVFKSANNYTEEMLRHSRSLKDIEHKRRMEMAEEEHAVKMQINNEILKRVKIEREIQEIKRDFEKKSTESALQKL